MRDDSLLKLENKLNNYSSKDIISSKFILKPEISRIDLSKGKDFVKNIAFDFYYPKASLILCLASKPCRLIGSNDNGLLFSE